MDNFSLSLSVAIQNSTVLSDSNFIFNSENLPENERVI